MERSGGGGGKVGIALVEWKRVVVRLEGEWVGGWAGGLVGWWVG